MRRSRCSSSFGHPPLRSRRVRPRRVRHVSATLSKTSVIASCTHRSGSFSSRSEIETVDDDLGRSAAGGVARAGFERMVADICLGKVGAVAAREVSRFARNSRDWQQLIEICRVVDTVLIDQETVYAPRQGNDRLLLGLKRSLNEYRSMPRATLGRNRSSSYVGRDKAFTTLACTCSWQLQSCSTSVRPKRPIERCRGTGRRPHPRSRKSAIGRWSSAPRASRCCCICPALPGMVKLRARRTGPRSRTRS